MAVRSSQLQIRVTPAQKAALKRLAGAAGQSVSEFVLGRVLPSLEVDFMQLVERLGREPSARRETVAELQGLLHSVPGGDLTRSIPEPAGDALPPILKNYVAALIESVCARRRVEPPAWTARTPPLQTPHFMWELPSLRAHQLRVTPAAFKRRNVFLDPRSEGIA